MKPAFRERPTSTPIVVIVDDDVDWVGRLRRGIMDAGYRPVWARDGHEALAAMTDEKPAAIFIDGRCNADTETSALLRSAVSNLLHNAVKFSQEQSKVVVSGARAEGRLTIEVMDGCGGLPPGKVEELFNPLVQRSANRSGFGLGLGIALQAAEAHNGTIKVRDLPGKGCVFVVDLPSTETAPPSK